MGCRRVRTKERMAHPVYSLYTVQLSDWTCPYAPIIAPCYLSSRKYGKPSDAGGCVSLLLKKEMTIKTKAVTA